MANIISLGVLILSFIVLDSLWLGVFARNFYSKELSKLSKTPFNFYSATVVYFCLVLGSFIFVLNNPFIQTPFFALIFGSILGLVIYGVYDFTNYATLKNYSLKLAIVDTLWGAVIVGLSSLLAKSFGLFI
jgi:uncharacterized membrane protein